MSRRHLQVVSSESINCPHISDEQFDYEKWETIHSSNYRECGICLRTLVFSSKVILCMERGILCPQCWGKFGNSKNPPQFCALQDLESS